MDTTPHHLWYCENCSTETKFVYCDNTTHICKTCGKIGIETNLLGSEILYLYPMYGKALTLEMDKLKKENLIDFQIKYNELVDKKVQANKEKSTANIPKCPTCGSTNIKKISGAKRWVGTGLFGLASSDLGKTMQCNNCGAKW